MQAAPTKTVGSGRAADWSMKGKTIVFTGASRPEGSSALSLDPVVQQHISDAAEAWAGPFLKGGQLSRMEAI